MSEQFNLGEIDFLDDPEISVAERDSDIAVVREVPDNMVAIAQKAWDEHKRYTLSFRGRSNEFITEFVKVMKFAGDHTTPLTTTTVVREPEDSIVVEIYSTQRRGRKVGSKNTKTTENGKAGESLPQASDEAKASVAAHAANAEKRPGK